MSGSGTAPSYYREAIPHLSYFVGGSTAPCGTTPTAVTVPAAANWALLHAEGAALYWTINGSTAGTGSYGYTAQDTTGFIPGITNLGTLHVAGATTAAIAHVEFYQD